MDLSCDETNKGPPPPPPPPPPQTHRLREFEQHLNDLKKENFSLKLRIYFLEEKIQQKFEQSDDDVHRRNIELKVQVESLKKELEENQQLLAPTPSAEQLSDQNAAELQRHLAERQQEISHVQEVLETKVQLLQQEAELARAEAQHMASLADSEAQRRQALERELVEKTEESKDQGLKDRLMEELREQKHALDLQVEELRARVHRLSSALAQRPQEVEQERLRGQELQKNQEQVRSLQARNQELQERLAAMQLDLHSAQEEARRHQRNLQNISDSVSTKEEEAAELFRVIEEQNALLCSPGEVARRCPLQASGAEAEVLTLQASLFQARLELQAGQRAQRRAARTQQDLQRALQRLEADLQGALQHRRDTERHNQELRRALEELRPALLEAQRCQAEAEQERRWGGEEQEATIRQLRSSLLARDQLIEDCELLEDRQETRDRLLQKLRLRVRERDRALQRAVDDKFDYVKEKEEESRRLQRLVGEAEREAARQRGVLADNQESIAGLQLLLRARSLELQQLRESCQKLQQQQQDSEHRHVRALKERDAVISQLQVALQTHAEESQVLRSSLLLPSAPSSVLEELKLRLQLKDRLFQEVLADRTQQAQEHQEQVQELLGTLRSRDQYIQDSASRLGEVMEEQSSRLQELRQQLSWSRGGTSEQEELQALKEELQVALRRSKENQELSRSQAATLESLSRRLHLKEEQIRDLRRTTEEPSHLPLVERLTQEVRELQESRAQQGGAAARGRERPGGGDTNTEDEDADEDESRLSVQMKEQRNPKPEGGGLTLLLQQKMLVETELWELKAQLEKAGFTSLSQMRNALLSVQAENTHLRQQLQPDQLEDEDALDGTIEGEDEEEEEIAEMWDTWHGQISLCHHEETLPSSSSLVDAGVFAALQPKSRDLQEPPTLPLPAEQQRLARTAVQQDSKLVQVDLQDLGYETCGRSENEAERADSSSPEFDDLQMCTSLACGSQGWPSGASSTSQTDQGPLRRLVDGLQAQLGSPSSSKDRAPSSAPKVSWCLEEDEGWQSSSDALPASPRPPRPDGDLRELVSRVDALEEQLREGARKPCGEDRKCPAWPGNFEVLIQSQARELSHLRQRLREAGGVCRVLGQHLGDTTKAFEELLRSNDIDFYLGQSFREQLAQSAALVQRVSAKIGGPGGPEEDPDEKTELLAMRLSKELQQKDKLIESLQARLNQHHHPHRSDTPSSGHALSEASDQSDGISYVSEDRGSTAEDLDPGSDVEQTDLRPHPSAPPPTSSSHQSWISCPGVQVLSSPHQPSDVRSHAAPPSAFLTSFQDPPPPLPPPFFSCVQRDPLPPHPRCRGNGSAGFSLAEAHQELQMLQRQLGVRERFSRPLHGFPPPSLRGHRPSPSGVTAGPLPLGADASSGSSGYRSGTSHTGSDLMKEHLREVRSLRQRLEDSISTNDRLRQQLEERLARTTPEKGPTNIYIQGLDSVGQLTTQVRYLTEEKKSLQEQLEEASRESSKEAELLKEAVLRERAKVKEAELEAEKMAAQSRRRQSQAEANGAEMAQLKHERLQQQEAIHRLQHEVSVLQQQLGESRRLVGSLQEELQVQRRVCAVPPTHTARTCSGERFEGADLTFDPSELQLQLEQQPSGRSPCRRQQLIGQCVASRQEQDKQPVRDAGLVGPAHTAAAAPPPLLPSLKHSGAIEDDAPGCFASPRGRHALGHMGDFDVLGQQLSEARLLLQEMEAGLFSLSASQELQLQQPSGSVAKLLSEAKMLQRLLEEAQTVLGTFWRAALPSPEPDRQSLRDQLAALRLRLSEQDQALKEAMERVRSSTRSRDHLESFVAGQLARTRDVLRKAKTNLQTKTLEDRVSSSSLLIGAS